MNAKVAERLDALRRDFADIVGRPLNISSVPFCSSTKETELCKAHVVNEAFTASSGRWTLQRKDVDNFFGSAFEAAFVDLTFNNPGIAVKALLDPALYRRLFPKVLLDGVEVEHFLAKGPIPKGFAELQLEHGDGSVRLGLKMDHDRLAAVSPSSDWQFEVCRDLRVPAVVSMLKAAHLTMFELLGYRYALRPDGVWLGHVLDSFYLENVGCARQGLLDRAATHFAPLAAMVRPVRAAPPAFTGTIDDGWVNLCWCSATDRIPWGIVTYVRTGDALHAVLLPHWSIRRVPIDLCGSSKVRAMCSKLASHGLRARRGPLKTPGDRSNGRRPA